MACVKYAEKNRGVEQQMAWEQMAARSLGVSWDVELWSISQPLFEVSKKIPKFMSFFFFRRLYFFLMLLVSSRKYQIIIYRYIPLDIFSVFLPKMISFVFPAFAQNLFDSMNERTSVAPISSDSLTPHISFPQA